MRMFEKKKIIFGCDSRGDAQSPYLTRWPLLRWDGGSVYLHRFHRSDSVEHHDHPWNFVSLILWRGYLEETVCSGCGGDYNEVDDCYTCGGSGLVTKRKLPGMLLFRKATHRHRVVLLRDDDFNECEAWSLVVRGPYVREWGFFTKVRGGAAEVWQRWEEYFKERGC